MDKLCGGDRHQQGLGGEERKLVSIQRPQGARPGLASQAGELAPVNIAVIRRNERQENEE